MSYSYKFNIKEKGLVEVSYSDFSVAQCRKYDYVKYYMEPAIVSAELGWDSVKFKVMRNSNGKHNNTTDYIVLATKSGSERWIDIEACSLGSILKSTIENAG